MIEIIKRGTKEKCTCKECGCLFSYDEEDIEKQTYTEGLYGYKKFIHCPQCECICVLEQTR